MSISELVSNVLSVGYLTKEAEEQLRSLPKIEPEDLEVFFMLQRAAMEGQVRVQSREQYLSFASC
ncbi:MAG: hypothetical protein F6K24_50555 [Okeania sp. SIO2D1]|nr:hypothetical protein [Okeania sp. SIO2D1]